DRNAKESWALLEDLALYDNESWNDPRDFDKPVKAITLPQDVPSTSDCRLIKLENQVQRLMEAHLAPMQPTQVNKVTISCEICSGPYDTQYCMEDPEQAFVKYASSHTDKAGGKWYTFKPEQNNIGDTYNPLWKSHSKLRWRQLQNSQNNFSNPPNRFQPNSSIPNCSFNNNPGSFNNQSNLEGLVSNFMASQDSRLSKFEADFKQQQSEMTHKIDIVLKVITNRLVGSLPSDTVKKPKLSTSLVLSTRSYPIIDPHAHRTPPLQSTPSKHVPRRQTFPRQASCKQGRGLERNHQKSPNQLLKMNSRICISTYRLGDSKPFDTLADLGSCVNIIPLYLFKNLNIGLSEETDHIFGLADGTNLTPGFLETANAVIDCRMAKIAVREGITRESYKPRPGSDRVGAQIPYYARKDFLDCHLPEEWEIARDAEINPFKVVLVFRIMVDFLGAIPINLKSNM
ncbi:hypothetical protein Tco_0887870, partial [Tanacetum coccineum]